MSEQFVMYTGATDEQVRWGSNSDPRGMLEEGKKYKLVDIEVHSWHTKYTLEGFPGMQFNSVSFEECDNDASEI